jgi:YVTN family beta-propeller protein
LLGCGLLAAQIPQATELPGKPFFVKKTWTIGGEGNWDYLTLDPAALLLFIPHGPVVQVVDVSGGTVAGQVVGLHDAHSVALDDDGQFGYVSDGPSNLLVVFDRRSMEVVARVPTGKNPRAVVFDAASRLIFVVCPDSTVVQAPASGGRRAPDPLAASTITVIDADARTRLADLVISGRLGFAQGDGKGTIYVNVTDSNRIVYFSATNLGSRLRAADFAAGAGTAVDGGKTDGGKVVNGKSGLDGKTDLSGKTDTGASKPAVPDTPIVDWSDGVREVQAVPSQLHAYRLGRDCESPRGLAIDSTNFRLFAGCSNMTMQVLNLTNGEVIATLPTGAGTEAVAYDADRGLIYASNGGGLGSLTVIRRDVNDSYAMIQEVPTQARARTVAVNPVSGEVYLVTNITGIDLTHKGGIGDIRTAALAGSFQVLVVGN